MHISRLDLNLYIVLDAIYNQGSITDAAKTLNLTQPAVSHALNRLREKLDDPLFIRQGKKMVPSPHTRNIISDIKSALHLLERTLEQESTFDPACSQKTFNLAMKDRAESALLGWLIPLVRQQAPGITINSIKANRRDLEKELIAGHIDMALDILLPVSNQIKHTPFSHDQMAVVASSEHPRIRHHLDLESYLAEEHVLVSGRSRGHSFEDFELSRLGYRRKVGLRCQSFEGACNIVSNTDLLLTMPETNARVLCQQFNNRIFPVPVSIHPLDTYLYWHKDMEKEPAHTWLRELILNQARKADGFNAVYTKHQPLCQTEKIKDEKSQEKNDFTPCLPVQ